MSVIFCNILGLMSLMGPKVLGDMQDKFGAKAYFNTLIPFEDGLIKYGVISRSNLIADLLDWESLYIAGRLQKPVRVLSKATKTVDQELHLGLRMNLKNALHTAFLLLPEKFTEERLYHTLVGLSYTGDFRYYKHFLNQQIFIVRIHTSMIYRMQVGEDKFKVSKITKGSINELRGLYAHQMTKMSEFVYFPRDTAGTDPSKQIFEQDTSPGARHFHLIMQPKNMQECLVRVIEKNHAHN
jgi:translocator assembly and maintenance protein 41